MEALLTAQEIKICPSRPICPRNLGPQVSGDECDCLDTRVGVVDNASPCIAELKARIDAFTGEK